MGAEQGRLCSGGGYPTDEDNAVAKLRMRYDRCTSRIAEIEAGDSTAEELSEVQSLQEELVQLKEEILDATLSSTSTDDLFWSVQKEVLVAEVNRLRQDVDDHGKESAGAHEAARSSNEELKSVREERDLLAQRLQKAMDITKNLEVDTQLPPTLEERIAALVGTVQTHAMQRDTAERKLNAISESRNRMDSKLHEELAGVRKELDEANASLAELKGAQAAVEQRHKDEIENLKQLHQQQLERHIQKQSELQAKITALETATPYGTFNKAAGAGIAGQLAGPYNPGSDGAAQLDARMKQIEQKLNDLHTQGTGHIALQMEQLEKDLEQHKEEQAKSAKSDMKRSASDESGVSEDSSAAPSAVASALSSPLADAGGGDDAGQDEDATQKAAQAAISAAQSRAVNALHADD